MSDSIFEESKNIDPIAEEELDFDKMDSKQKWDYLKVQAHGRDAKTGKFLKGHSGNKKGRPRQKTTLEACLAKSFARKAMIKIDGKMVSTTNLQLACDLIVQDSIAKKDSKTIIQLFKAFGSKIDITDELPPPKVKTKQNDPYYDESVEKIKRAIYQRLDKQRDENNQKGK